MSHKSFSYKGYDIYLAAVQASKRERGGTIRSLQVRKDNVIVKSFRYKFTDPYAFGQASIKATKWIDERINPPSP
jgi:hypothetical protein